MLTMSFNPVVRYIDLAGLFLYSFGALGCNRSQRRIVVMDVDREKAA